MDKQKIASSFREVQEFICSKLEEIDGKSIFESDKWSRSEGGGGITNTIKDGNVIEKGGVAFLRFLAPFPNKCLNSSILMVLLFLPQVFLSFYIQKQFSTLLFI